MLNKQLRFKKINTKKGIALGAKRLKINDDFEDASL